MFLGIDIGSSFIKYALLEKNKSLRGTGRIETPPFKDSGFTDVKEYDPEKLFQSVKKIIDEMISSYNIEGVLFSTQMHGMILLDSNGTPLTNYVSWQDERAFRQIANENTSYFEKLNLAIDKIQPYTGTQKKINVSKYPLFYFMQKAKTKNSRLMMMGDFLAYRLTGRISPCHITNAASTGMLNMKENVWDKEIIKAVGAEDVDFPEIALEVCSAGRYKGADVYCAVGDHQSSVLGSGIGDCDAILNIATGSQISVISDNPVFGSFETRPYFNEKHMLCDIDLPSGRDISILADYLRIAYGIENVWGYIDTAVSESIKSGRETIHVDFGMLRTEKCFYINMLLDEGNKMSTVLYSAVRSIVEEAHISLGEMAEISKIRNIVLAGGLPHILPSLLMLTEEIFDIKCGLCKEKEEALSGLLVIASNLKQDISS